MTDSSWFNLPPWIPEEDLPDDDFLFSEEELNAGEVGIWGGLYDELSPEEEEYYREEFRHAHQLELFEKESARGKGPANWFVYDIPKPEAQNFDNEDVFLAAVNAWKKDRRKEYKRQHEARRYWMIQEADCPWPPPVEVWERVLEASEYRCYWCLRGIEEVGKFTMDHYIPVTKGGDNCEGNLVPACGKCNSLKGEKLPEDFLNYVEKQIEVGNPYFSNRVPFRSYSN